MANFDTLIENLDKTKVLTVREFIKLLIHTNFKYALKVKQHTIYNFKFDETENRVYLLSDDNHNFLLNSSKINDIASFINKLLDVNLDAEVYYNDKNIITIYQNSYLNMISIVVNDTYEDANYDEMHNIIKMFTDKRTYYNNLLKSITGFSNISIDSSKYYPNSWDELFYE